MTDQNNTPHHVLSQAVDREVRQLLGDLQMQVVVLRQMLELAQRPAKPADPAEPVPPMPQPGPTPQPGQVPPGQVPTEPPPPQPHAMNGRTKTA